MDTTFDDASWQDTTFDDATSQSSSTSSTPDGFRTFGNRKYTFNDNPKYMLPSCDIEMDRLDHQHYVARHLMHGNFSAPVEDALERGITVLDAGCGSGRWCLEMAEDFPCSTFIGVDISGVFPTVDIPSNLTFVKANTLTGLPFDDCTFDYVFQRFLGTSFSSSNWEVAVGELMRITKPGGWVELFEGVLKLNNPPPEFNTLSKAFNEVLLARGIDEGMVHVLPQLLTAQGFEEVFSDFVSAAIGWNGRVGAIMKTCMMNFWEAYRPIVMPKLGLDDDGYTNLYVRAFHQTTKAKTYMNIPYAYGRKPIVK